MILYATVYATELELMLNMKFEYLGGYFFKLFLIYLQKQRKIMSSEKI